MPRTREPATSLTAAAPLWQSFVRRLTSGDPVARFTKPKGVVRAKIDAWSGGRPGAWTSSTRTELFRAGTQPGGKRQVDRPGLLYSRACGTWVVDPLKAELGPRAWDRDVLDWLVRARRGVGVEGRLGSRTAYFWDRSSWGGRLDGPCPKPKPVKEPPGKEKGKPPKEEGPVPKPPEPPVQPPADPPGGGDPAP